MCTFVCVGYIHIYNTLCLCVKTCSKFLDFTSIPRQKSAYGTWTLVCPNPSVGVVVGG